MDNAITDANIGCVTDREPRALLSRVNGTSPVWRAYVGPDMLRAKTGVARNFKSEAAALRAARVAFKASR